MHIAIYLDDGEVLSKKTSVAGQTRSAVYGDRGWGRHRPAAQRDCRHPSDAAVCAGWFILGIAILTPIFHTTWENTQMDCKEERKKDETFANCRSRQSAMVTKAAWFELWGFKIGDLGAPLSRSVAHCLLELQGVFFNWCSPKSSKCFLVSKMFRTFKLVPP